jgi:ubiquitin carboxyl-terminal hydrolase L3
MGDRAWVALESNPEVLTKYMHKLGVSTKWNFIDVYSFDDDSLQFLPDPVKAYILLFPCSAAYEKHREEQSAKLKETPPEYPADLFFMKQVIHNACGAIALVHSVANGGEIEISPGILQSYLEQARALSVEERGKLLEADTSFTGAHEEIAREGQTAAPSPDDDINHHFVALVERDGEIFELDGRKQYPINHGKVEKNFKFDAIRVFKEFMERDPDNIRFTVVALVPVN